MTTQPKLTHDERCAGKKADYLVYYRDARGKLFYQAIWAPDMTTAASRLVAMTAELGTKATVVRTLVRRPGAPIGAAS